MKGGAANRQAADLAALLKLADDVRDQAERFESRLVWHSEAASLPEISAKLMLAHGRLQATAAAYAERYMVRSA